MNRRSFLKLLGIAGAVAAVPVALSATVSSPTGSMPVSPLLPACDGFEVPSGYYKTPDGRVFMWGVAGTDGRAVFPLIPYKIVSVVACGADPDSTNPIVIVGDGLSERTFKNLDGTPADGACYVVIGRCA